MELQPHSFNHFLELGMDFKDYNEYLAGYLQQQRPEANVTIDQEHLGRIAITLYGEGYGEERTT